MNLETVSVLLYILAGLFLIQSLFTVILFFVVNSKLNKAEHKLVTASQRSAGQVRNLRALLVRLNRAMVILPVLEKTFTKILDKADEKLQKADQFAESTLNRSTVQIEEIGRKLEYSLKHFDRQTSHIEKMIQNPTKRASALIQGLIAGFKELFKSNRSFQPATHSPDDDAFI